MISMDGNDNDPNDDSRTEITSGEFQNVSNRIVKSDRWISQLLIFLCDTQMNFEKKIKESLFSETILYLHKHWLSKFP